MKNYISTYLRSKPQPALFSEHFHNGWKRGSIAYALEAAVFLEKYNFKHFRFPAFPAEMERLETQATTRKALVLLGKTCAAPFPVSKTHFREKPLFFNGFRFPGIVYKYIYVGNTLHIYLICKNWPRKHSQRRPVL